MEKIFWPYARYFEFAGRSDRAEFWLFSLFTWSVMIGLFVAAGGLSAISADAPEVVWDELFMSIPFLLIIVFAIFSFIPGLAVTVRRFHDAGFSGWVYLGLLLLSLIPVIGLLADLGMLVIAVLPSVQSNKWGDNPRDGWEREGNYGYDVPEPAARPSGGVRLR